MAAIDTYAVTSSTAKALRALNKYGMNLADFAALTTNSSFDGFGNGTGYTVSNWISDGVFANLAAVQAVYPICQSGSDTVDWVLLQSAVDFMIYGSLGNANRKTTKTKLFIPAGNFVCNRTINIGYSRVGTPPADLNGNGYVTISIEGEGRQTDVGSANGMTGTSIDFQFTTGVGFAVSRYQVVKIKGMTIRGGYSYMVSNNNLYGDQNWDREALKGPVATDNWLEGAAVNVGIAMDPYSDAGAAAAYPARILPSYFGGGTSTAQMPNGGTTVEIEDVRIEQFVIGAGRPSGDSNGEFYRFKDVDIYLCAIGISCGHSQNRNISLRDVNFELCHTAISSQGGLQGNANLHGEYSNIHIGRCFQIFEHPAGGWSGPVTFENMYAESFFRLGSFPSGVLIFRGAYLSSLDQEGTHGSAYNHFSGEHLVLDGCNWISRDGLYCDVTTGGVHVMNGTFIRGSSAPVVSDSSAAQGMDYVGRVFSNPGLNVRTLSNSDWSRGRFGNRTGRNAAATNMTYLDQEWFEYYSQFPSGGDQQGNGEGDAVGSVFRYPVPKIGRFLGYVTPTSRSGLDLTCNRAAHGPIPADLGDVYAVQTDESTATQGYTWFIVHGISGGNMILRQLNNFAGDSQFDYRTNGRTQVGVGDFNNNTFSLCTRIRRNARLFFGEVTSGSAVISNIRGAFQGTTDTFTDANFDMTVGDWFLHQEPQKHATGSATKVPNKVTAIDYTANTITLTDNFLHADTKYPIVFYVRQFNA